MKRVELFALAFLGASTFKDKKRQDELWAEIYKLESALKDWSIHDAHNVSRIIRKYVEEGK